MHQPHTTASLTGVVRQIGFVVSDLDAAMVTWLQLGVGPFYTVRNAVQDCIYRGEQVTV